MTIFFTISTSLRHVNGGDTTLAPKGLYLYGFNNWTAVVRFSGASAS